MEWFDIGVVEHLQKGEHKAITINNIPIVVFNLNGEYFAIENRCTHQDFPLSEGEVLGDQIACPLHGARFCIKTGQALSPPAFIDVATFPVRVFEGRVQVGIP